MSLKQKTLKMTPNILVVSPNEQSFQRLKSYLARLLGKNSYTIYKLSESDIENTGIWMKNCVLLVTLEQILDHYAVQKKDMLDTYLKYLENGGRILSLPDSQNQQTQRKSDIQSKFWFEQYYEVNPSFKKEICSIGSSMFANENIFYFYSMTNTSGVHFVSKVNKVQSVKFFH
jgi:hypothetical protein